MTSITKPFLLGIDQGTSGSRALILDAEGQVRGYGYRALPRLHPHPDWVEQDPYVVADGVAQAIDEALAHAKCQPDEIAACGIACQRNTDFVWDAITGKPLSNAITWQDLRTLSTMLQVEGWSLAHQYRRRLGRLPGAYSSALHLAWRMQNDLAVIEAARNYRLRIGFSAAWLLQALGSPAAHLMDFSLVQAMGLYDFRMENYWPEWLEHLKIPRSALPDPSPTLSDFGTLRISSNGMSAEAPVLAMIGDQQAALFGYDCRVPGDAECTHGTATFVDVFLGGRAPEQENLNVYYAWHLGDILSAPGRFGHTYCLEADTTVTGAALRWMREGARFLDQENEIGPLAATVPDSGGVMFVPAFTGLNVPYDDANARGTLLGLTLGTNRAHIARAFLEAIGYQVRAILETIQQDAGIRVDRLHVGGGLAASDLACQIQADILGIPIIRPEFTQTTARATALLAGLGAGVWPDLSHLPPMPGNRLVFEPTWSLDQRDEHYARWQRAVRTAQLWAWG